MKRLVFLIAAMAAGSAIAEKQPLSRYQSIIDRQMFGALPPGFDPTKSPSEVARTSAAAEKELTQEQEKLQSAVHFSVINVTPEGETAVGFTDNSDPKAPKHYYLKVGEERDGWLVKEANAAEASMTIAKGEIEVTLKIGDNSAKGGGTTEKAGAAGSTLRAGGRGGLGGGGLRSHGLGSLRARRQMREQQAAAAQAALAADAAQKEAERKAREDAERAEREAERAAQRQQLLAIQEELRKNREAEEARKAREAEGAKNDGNDAQ